MGRLRRGEETLAMIECKNVENQQRCVVEVPRLVIYTDSSCTHPSANRNVRGCPNPTSFLPSWTTAILNVTSSAPQPRLGACSTRPQGMRNPGITEESAHILTH